MIFIGVYVAVVLAAAVMVIRQPAKALIMIYCMFVFEQWAQANHILFLKKSWVTNVLIGVIVLLGALRQYTRRGHRLEKWSFGTKTIWTLFLFAFVSIGWSVNPQTGIDIWQEKFPYLLTALFLVPWILKGEGDLVIVYRDFIIVAFVLIAVIFMTTDWSIRRIVLASEWVEVVGNPLEVATLAGLLMVVAVFFATSKATGMWGVFGLAALVLGTVVIVRTGSRGQMIAALLVIATLLPIKLRLTSVKFVVASIFLAFAAITAMNLAVEQYWKGMKRWDQELALQDIASRLSQSTKLLADWWNDLAAIAVGFGNSASFDLIGYYPHIVSVEILAEEGVIGLVLFIMFLSWLSVMFLRKIKDRAIAENERTTLFIAAAVFLYFFLLSFKQGSLVGSQMLFMSGIVLSGLVRRGKKRA